MVLCSRNATHGEGARKAADSCVSDSYTLPAYSAEIWQVSKGLTRKYKSAVLKNQPAQAPWSTMLSPFSFFGCQVMGWFCLVGSGVFFLFSLVVWVFCGAGCVWEIWRGFVVGFGVWVGLFLFGFFSLFIVVCFFFHAETAAETFFFNTSEIYPKAVLDMTYLLNLGPESLGQILYRHFWLQRMPPQTHSALTWSLGCL